MHALISDGCIVGIFELATAVSIPAEFWFVYGSAEGVSRCAGKIHMYAKRGKTN